MLRAALRNKNVTVVAVNDPFIDLAYMVSIILCDPFVHGECNAKILCGPFIDLTYMVSITLCDPVTDLTYMVTIFLFQFH